MTNENYSAAQRLAKKNIQYLTSKKLPAEIPVLDDVITGKEIAGEIPLGLVDIPVELIAGTKTAGRSASFAPNYMPLLDENSEFAGKWEFLYNAQISEGIREPVKAYEYLNKYYILEGNKRVSVLKYCGAVSVPGYVTRLLPARRDEKEIRIYYEFLDFYHATSINYVILTQEGAYRRLTALTGKRRYERWNPEERLTFRSAYIRFADVLNRLRERESRITTGDALLSYLELFGYERLCKERPDEIETNIKKIKAELLLVENDREVNLKLDPEPDKEPKRNFLNRILPPLKEDPHYKIAFIHTKNAENSSWTYSHELGRSYLETQYPGAITTLVYNNISGTEAAYAAIEDAILRECEIIFTTTPEFLDASLKAAIEHPEVKILNCSLNTPHKYIRTYYGRMYEAKFLNGVLAGIMTTNGRIGYIADYPIYGMTANINAFALGVHMVNPHARVFLEWSTEKGNQGADLTKKFLNQDITLISNQDMITPINASREFGLYQIDGEQQTNLACPVWHWGKYYERIIRTIQNGNWEREERADGQKALNYWWGMSSGAIDIIWSPNIGSGTIHLIEILKESICRGEFNPFFGEIPDQNGIIHGTPDDILSLQEIVTMNWLVQNIEGRIPAVRELKEDANAVVSLYGTNPEEPEE